MKQALGQYLSQFYNALNLGTTKTLHALGLDETRCVMCHTPFSSASFSPLCSALTLCLQCRTALQQQGPWCPCCGTSLDRDHAVRDHAVKDHAVPEHEARPAPCGACLEPDRPAPCGACLEPDRPAPCGACLVHPPPWRKFYQLGSYEGALRQLILRGKFYGDAPVLNLLGTLLVERCAHCNPPPQAVVPVPLHVQRLGERGFNQSHEVARPLAVFFKVPLASHWLVRTTPTRSQRGLSRAERLANLEGAFVAPCAEVNGQRLLLVDDVITTGTTLVHAVQALQAAGAAHVDVAVLARTQQDRFFESTTSFEPKCRFSLT